MRLRIPARPLRAAAGRVAIRVWCNQGQESEHRAMLGIARAFNAAHAAEGVSVSLTFFPDYQYTEKTIIAAAAHDLPDALDIDGPLVSRYVAAALLAPLGAWIPPADRADFLPTLLSQGTVDGRLYALGAFDSAIVLYYDRDLLARAGVTPPPRDQAWTWDQFLAACGRLRASGIRPVAMHLDQTSDEWFTYAFSPVLWSAGGALIAPDGRTVRGVLDSAVNIRALRQWQRLFLQGYASANPVDPDPFADGKVAMDWYGHWAAPGHLAAKGRRLGAMLLPRMGPREVVPCGSWCWAVSARSRHSALAAEWIRWVTSRRHGVDPMVRANGAVPARRSAFADFPEYARDPYRLFRYQLEHFARPRPKTPFYPALTEGFAQALRDIAHGADPGVRLREAAAEIQRVIDRKLGREDPR
jgi:multiple sugar transport system substrate-binding protein